MSVRIYVVTPKGPCRVSDKTLKKILDRKKMDERYKSQVLFHLRILAIPGVQFNFDEEEDGPIPCCPSLEEFEQTFLGAQTPPGNRPPVDPPQNPYFRNILL